jgi:hypothetical protein
MIFERARKIKKSFGSLIGSALVACALVAGSPEGAEAKPGFYADANLSLSYENAVVRKAEDVPLEIRNLDYRDISGSKSDYCHAPPIEKDSVELYDRLSLLKARLGGKIPFFDDKFVFKLGVGCDFNMDISFDGKKYRERKDSGTRAYDEWSYVWQKKFSNNSKGNNFRGKLNCEPADTSEYFDYYYVHPCFWFGWNTVLRPAVFSELELKIGKNKSISLGYEIFREDIFARNGWMRREDIKNEDYELMSLVVGRPYVSFAISEKEDDMRFYAGVEAGMNNVLAKEKKGLGEQMEFGVRDGFFLGVKLGVDF